ncbi:MAG: phosphatase PAP2 family protein [Alphaproteobacteria bacterium]|nr:phosphatase PAP2 family protein [Alphaproteobacteria bacterium]MBU2378965.1 phosphatase PAP2 family protein [Alphaproteobacteria bacterium]
MMALRAVIAASFAVALSGCITGPSSAPARTVAETAPGYLSQGTLESLASAVPAAPSPGSPEAVADIAASDRLRALEDTDRWLLATRHAELRPALALSHFDCALETRLSAEDSPRLVALLARVLHDANEAAELAKARDFRARPVSVDPDRRACQVASAAGRASPSYPSGSATVGAAFGAAFAALAPDHAEAANRIGHEIGVSRAVCAMHYPADVVEGERLGRTVFTRIAATPAFGTDLAAARSELARARAAGLTSPACAAERAALATPLP